MSDQNTPQVGFGSPPVDGRFKKGKSGNPRGRPKKQDNVYTLLQRVLKRKVRQKGSERQIPVSEALIRKLREQALSGDSRAINLQRRIMDEAGVNQTEHFDPEEKKQRVLNALNRMGVKIEKSESNDV